MSETKSRRPVMRLLDLLGRRWALRVLWELHTAGDPLTFRALRERASEMSSSVLATRLKELTEAGIVTRTGDGYALSPLGTELVAMLLPLNEWSERWAAG